MEGGARILRDQIIGADLINHWCPSYDIASDPDQVPSDSLWHWSEFKASLNLRGLLPEQRIPPQLDPAANINMAARLALRSLGLELVHQRHIQVD